MSQYMISTDSLTKQYHGVSVVDNVSIKVNQGSICGLIGCNGAGKTTLLRLLTGLIKPTRGSFELCQGMARQDSTVSAIVESASLCKNMNAYANLTLRCKLLGIEVTREYLDKLLKLVNLDFVENKKVKDFSLGMCQRLAIAMTLIGNPKLLMLDEPINGLDPQGIMELRQLLIKLNHELGVTILISSHILSELDKLATEYIIMEQGKVLCQLTAQQLQAHSKKGLRLVVKQTQQAVDILKANGYNNLEVQSDNSIMLYEDVPSTTILLLLAQHNIEVLAVTTLGGTLEDVYLELIGGAR